MYRYRICRSHERPPVRCVVIDSEQCSGPRHWLLAGESRRNEDDMVYVMLNTPKVSNIESKDKHQPGHNRVLEKGVKPKEKPPAEFTDRRGSVVHNRSSEKCANWQNAHQTAAMTSQAQLTLRMRNAEMRQTHHPRKAQNVVPHETFQPKVKALQNAVSLGYCQKELFSLFPQYLNVDVSSLTSATCRRQCSPGSSG
jgi:hypothetical protein